jgi:hypothetical protein
MPTSQGSGPGARVARRPAADRERLSGRGPQVCRRIRPATAGCHGPAGAARPTAPAQRGGGLPAAVGRRGPRRPTAAAADTPLSGRGTPRPTSNGNPTHGEGAQPACQSRPERDGGRRHLRQELGTSTGARGRSRNAPISGPDRSPFRSGAARSRCSVQRIAHHRRDASWPRGARGCSGYGWR